MSHPSGRREAEAVEPYRRWVRKLTGAERDSRQVSAAISAGTGAANLPEGRDAGQGLLGMNNMPGLGLHDLPLFVASCVLLNLTPGADTLFVVTRSAALGLRAGLAAALGIGAGCCVHVLAAALGLSALLAASATAFEVVKWLGALYLVYMGVTMLWPRGGARGDTDSRAAGACTLGVHARPADERAQPERWPCSSWRSCPSSSSPRPRARHSRSSCWVRSSCSRALCGACCWRGWSARMSARAAAVGERPAAWSRGLSRACGVLFVVLGVRLAVSPAP